MNLSIKKTCTDQLSTRKKRRTKLVLMLWGTDQEVLGGWNNIGYRVIASLGKNLGSRKIC